MRPFPSISMSIRAAGANVLVWSACAAFVACGPVQAQTPAPPLEPKPVFTPGMYETESRNSAFQDQPVKSQTCIASADCDAFRDETMAQYQKAPQFAKDCRLSDTNALRAALCSRCSARGRRRF